MLPKGDEDATVKLCLGFLAWLEVIEREGSQVTNWLPYLKKSNDWVDVYRLVGADHVEIAGFLNQGEHIPGRERVNLRRQRLLQFLQFYQSA